ncbi:hypothetical protein [Flavisphingomonas formosensis]|uniref:hypothetical protein n=1 Tax=Flavisphingomonas formosensis TaxID=861534 RepID=UPI0012F79E37|nr:hypothetical protein [Sphingomonas formosensis]
MRFYHTLFLISSCLLGGCDPKDASYADLMGEWRSDQGYSVTLRPDRSFRFCDGSACFDGRFRNPGGIEIELQDFFKHTEAKRFVKQAGMFENVSPGSLFYPGNDLSFSVTSDNNRSNWCGKEICVLYGSVETRDHIAFIKQ